MKQTISPMTLGNMRANGVRTLAVWCGGRGCNHQAVLGVSRYADEVPVPAFGPRMVCTVRGIFVCIVTFQTPGVRHPVPGPVLVPLVAEIRLRVHLRPSAFRVEDDGPSQIATLLRTTGDRSRIVTLPEGYERG